MIFQDGCSIYTVKIITKLILFGSSSSLSPVSSSIRILSTLPAGYQYLNRWRPSGLRK